MGCGGAGRRGRRYMYSGDTAILWGAPAYYAKCSLTARIKSDRSRKRLSWEFIDRPQKLILLFPCAPRCELPAVRAYVCACANVARNLVLFQSLMDTPYYIHNHTQLPAQAKLVVFIFADSISDILDSNLGIQIILPALSHVTIRR